METLKKQIIRTFATVTDAEALKQSKVIITTALGLISGKMYNSEDVEQEDIGNRFVADFAEGIAKKYDLANIDGNDGFILLKDVTILTGSKNTFNIPNLIVFYDQIIGITIGSID